MKDDKLQARNDSANPASFIRHWSSVIDYCQTFSTYPVQLEVGVHCMRPLTLSEAVENLIREDFVALLWSAQACLACLRFMGDGTFPSAPKRQQAAALQRAQCGAPWNSWPLKPPRIPRILRKTITANHLGTSAIPLGAKGKSAVKVPAGKDDPVTRRSYPAPVRVHDNTIWAFRSRMTRFSRYY